MLFSLKLTKKSVIASETSQGPPRPGEKTWGVGGSKMLEGSTPGPSTGLPAGMALELRIHHTEAGG